MPEGTVLAFDYGTKRVGVAVGEPALGTAHALPGIAASGEQLMASLAALVAEWKPVKLVVGVPVDTAGAAHEMTRRAERFARQLEARFRLPVARVDERYTSAEAESRLREATGARRAAKASRERALDSLAARVILEQYLAEAA